MLNTPAIKDLAALLRAAGFVIGPVDDAHAAATPNDALRVAEAMEKALLVVVRKAS